MYVMRYIGVPSGEGTQAKVGISYGACLYSIIR